MIVDRKAFNNFLTHNINAVHFMIRGKVLEECGRNT